MPPLPHYYNSLKPRPKSSVTIAYILCPLFLCVSGYGFWIWSKLSPLLRINEPMQLFYMLTLIIAPLGFCFLAAIIAAQRMEYDKFFISFQSRIDQMQKRLNAEEDLLNSLTDHNPEAVAIFDKHNNYWFVNASAARLLGVNPKDVIGMASTKYPRLEGALRLTSYLNEVRSTNRATESLQQMTLEMEQIRFLQTYYEPIKLSADLEGGIMVRWQDVTTLIVQRERNENMLRQIIATLVAVVDRRDPYAAGHSERVGFLSRAIAEELVLAERDIDAASIAGSLLNFGKVLVPRELLTKKGALSVEELKLIREAMLNSSDVLSMIDFACPVVPTLKQSQERYDGTGAPYGLMADQILMTARVVAVANAYVALVSSRAHRPGLTGHDALQQLMGDADKAYDRKVVTALANYIANRKNKPEWLRVAKPV
jgi:PAS domain S-box-containing protein